MYCAAPHRTLTQGARSVVHHLKLIDGMEVCPQHAMRRALGEERHGRVDALVLGSLDEVGAPAEMPIRQVALNARVFHVVVSFDQRHFITPVVRWLFAATQSGYWRRSRCG